MIRLLVSTVILIPVLAAAALYVAYGEAQPCRVLAVEKARRSILPTVAAEPLMRMETDTMSNTQCVKSLFRSWRERIEDK